MKQTQVSNGRITEVVFEETFDEYAKTQPCSECPGKMVNMDKIGSMTVHYSECMSCGMVAKWIGSQ